MRVRITALGKEIGVPATEVARRLGVSVDFVERACESGRMVGACRHPQTRKWWIYRAPGGRGSATWPLRRDLYPGLA
jgi:hypothetical protein